jgi:Sec-independent protein translocase protein TatA
MGVGTTELVVVGLVMLQVLGQRLLAVMRDLGRSLTGFSRGIRGNNGS